VKKAKNPASTNANEGKKQKKNSFVHLILQLSGRGKKEDVQCGNAGGKGETEARKSFLAYPIKRRRGYTNAYRLENREKEKRKRATLRNGERGTRGEILEKGRSALLGRSPSIVMIKETSEGKTGLRET